MPDVYLNRSEFYALGLPARAFVSAPVVLSAADPAADVLTAAGHGLSNGDRVRLAVNQGGGLMPSAVLPAGLLATVLYYVVGVDLLGGDMLQLALTLGGSAVNFTDAGSGVFYFVRDAGADIDLVLEAWCRRADQKLIGNKTPLTSAPLSLKSWLAHLAAYDLATTKGLVAPEYRDDPALAERARVAQAELDSIERSGKPLAGADDGTPGEPDNGAIGWSDGARGWDGI
jgi:hypothetical protein